MIDISGEWLASLLAIIMIDLLLAGDNAIVIALAARRLPKRLQKRAIYAGTAGAILIRTMLVFFSLQLLKIPGLSLGGGMLLYWVAWRLLAKNDKTTQNTAAADTFGAAMRTIIVADTIMSLDNVLAIAGASRGDLGLVIFGFLLSIPIMVGGSVIILRWLEKVPWLMVVGCGLLTLIAGRMVMDDSWVREQMTMHTQPLWEWLIITLTAVVFTFFASRAIKPKSDNQSQT